MIIPVRCFTCGKPISSQYEEYKKLVAEGKTAKEAMDTVQVPRYCCRRMLLAQVDYLDEVTEYQV